MDTTFEERDELLLDAREHLETAIELIRQAVSGTEVAVRANAYILPHLERWIGDEYTSIEALRNDLMGRGDEEDDDDLTPAERGNRAGRAEAQARANGRYDRYQPMSHMEIVAMADRITAETPEIKVHDRADMFYRFHHNGDYERVTVSRPDRPGDSRTYDLDRISVASRNRLLSLILERRWSYRTNTTRGWHAVTTA
ncbi:MAG: hypothetical protein JW910_18050 [Anaerolineae bacterium]|nr:hypothetical protein [Anaerolineae bacterium]